GLRVSHPFSSERPRQRHQDPVRVQHAAGDLTDVVRTARRPDGILVPDFCGEYWAISLWHRRADVQPLRLRPQRLDRRLDRILLVLVDFMVPVRGGIPCPYFAWPHDTAVRRRRTARTYGVHIHVDDGV